MGSIQYAKDKLLISSESELFVVCEDDFMNLTNNAQNINCKPVISDENKIYSIDYNAHCDSVIVSYDDHHSIVSLEKGNDSNLKIEYDGPSTARTSLLCVGNAKNKYVVHSDKKQKLKIISSDFNDNKDYRFETTLHGFGHSVCRDIQVFDDKMIACLCNNYLLFYNIIP